MEIKIPEEIQAKVKKNNPKRIGIQLPFGLKMHAGEIEELIHTFSDAEIVLVDESNFGACDLRDREAKDLSCDLLLHFGHSDMHIRTEVPTFYIEFPYDLDPVPSALKALKNIPEKKLGLFTTVQYIHQLPRIKEELEKAGKEIVIGDNNGRSTYPGQVLGCDYSSATNVTDQVDAFLYIGSGDFHPLGVQMATEKKVHIADPEMGEHRDLLELKDKLLRQRFAKIELAKEAKKFGIILSVKKGQRRDPMAFDAKKKLEKSGREAHILFLDNVSPELLYNYKLDAFVNTACPRITIDDAHMYKQPMLTPQELDIMLGEREWDDYLMDHF